MATQTQALIDAPLDPDHALAVELDRLGSGCSGALITPTSCSPRVPA